MSEKLLVIVITQLIRLICLIPVKKTSQYNIKFDSVTYSTKYSTLHYGSRTYFCMYGGICDRMFTMLYMLLWKKATGEQVKSYYVQLFNKEDL
jgi:isocitrate dehydrogenase kinase/phosphatase